MRVIIFLVRMVFRFYAVIFFGLFGAVGIGLTGFGAYGTYLSVKVALWPTATARLWECDLTKCSNSKSYRVDVVYSYSVKGTEYAGTRIYFGYEPSSVREEQFTLFAQLRDASLIRVFYDPDNPSESAITYGAFQPILFILILGITFLVVTAEIFFFDLLTRRRDSRVIERIVVEERRREDVGKIVERKR